MTSKPIIAEDAIFPVAPSMKGEWTVEEFIFPKAGEGVGSLVDTLPASEEYGLCYDPLFDAFVYRLKR